MQGATSDGRRPGVVSTAVELRRAERRLRWSRTEVERYQLAHLQSLVAYASANVELYRRRLGSGASIDSLADLRNLPLTRRSDVTGVPIEDRRGTPRNERTLAKRTSGTTGAFLEVEMSARAAWWQGVLELRRNRARGLQPWQRTAAIRIDPDSRPRRGLLGALAGRASVIDGNEDPAAIAGRVAALDPAGVIGMGHLLIDVGRLLEGRARPRVVGTAGQVLTPGDRAEIRELFGSSPLDLYGAREVGSIAWQCSRADLYHVEHDSVIVEIVDSEGAPVPPGETGDVVLTGLHNPHMPFIRYRTGDQARAAARPCICGAHTPMIDQIEGREADRFVDERGRRVSSARLFLSVHVDDASRWVRRYRVVQGDDRAVTVEAIPCGSIPDHVVDRVRAGYQGLLGASIPITVRPVERIPLEPSGKLRQFVSHVQPASQR